MGTFRVSMTVANPSSGVAISVEAVVDTGATLTALPRALVQQLDLQQEDTAAVQLADGTVQELALGTARLTVEGRSRTTPVLFFPGHDAPTLLGAVTLEAMGLAVDPVGQKLVPQELLLLVSEHVRIAGAQ